RLSDRDLGALLRCILEVRGSLGLDGFVERVISAIPDLIPSEVTTYNEIEPARHRVRASVFPSDAMSFAEWHEVFAAFVSEHPLVQHYRRTRDGRALKITDLLAQDRFKELGLYREFYARAGVDRQMAVTIPSSPGVVIGI